MFYRFVKSFSANSALRKIAKVVIPASVRVHLPGDPRAAVVIAAGLARTLGMLPPAYSAASCELLLRKSAPVQTTPSTLFVICCGALYPGGAERQAVNTLRGLAERGYRDRLLLLADRLKPSPERHDFYLPDLQNAQVAAREIRRADLYAERHMRSKTFAASRYLPNELAADVLNLYREFVELKPAVVHAWLDWSNVRAGLAAVLAGVPKVILSGRNLNPSNFFFDAPYMRPAYQALSQHPNVILVNNSEAGAADYADWIGIKRDRIEVIRNGVDFAETSRPSLEAVRQFRQSLGASVNTPLIGGLFRLSPEKRPELWIEAASVVAAARPDCRFVIFGGGPLRERLLALAADRGLGKNLTIKEVTEQPLTAIAAFDICLLTSAAEGTPNVVLEAQWIGTPVVATEGGGTREALDIGESGWLVEQAAPKQIAETVLQILAGLKYKSSAAKRGPAFVASRFGMDRMIRETLQLYGLDGKSECKF